MTNGRRIAVVGAGVSGLATAWFLERAGHRATVFEAQERLGGKIRTVDLAAAPFDVGADAFLTRQPEFVELCQDLGLGDDLVAPATGQVWLWFRDGLRRLPPGTIMGLPADLDALSSTGVLSPVGLAAARAESALRPPSLAPDADPPLRPFVVERYGVEVADRLVDPLVSGIYAGDIATLGLRSATPLLAALVDEAVRRQTPMSSVLMTRRNAAAADASPVFNTVRGGLYRVVEALVERVGDVRTRTPVTSLDRQADGTWSVAGESFDAVVVATPSGPAAKLLEPIAPDASAELSQVGHASAVVVSFAFEEGTRLPAGSGMLVPRDQGRFLKAATWSSLKWPHLAERKPVLLRCSAGRRNDEAHLRMTDEEVLAVTLGELREAVGIATEPLDQRVTRWHDALPQYDAGHNKRMAAARAAAAEAGVSLAGAAHHGVGLPACVRSARLAADEVLAGLA